MQDINIMIKKGRKKKRVGKCRHIMGSVEM
jgi:hypothetical protein